MEGGRRGPLGGGGGGMDTVHVSNLLTLKTTLTALESRGGERTVLETVGRAVTD